MQNKMQFIRNFCILISKYLTSKIIFKCNLTSPTLKIRAKNRTKMQNKMQGTTHHTINHISHAITSCLSTIFPYTVLTYIHITARPTAIQLEAQAANIVQ